MMSTTTKLIRILTLFQLSVLAAYSQTVELSSSGTSVKTGNGFGPRITPHQITFAYDPNNATLNNNSPLSNAASIPSGISCLAPTKTIFTLANQTYSGLTYGAGTVNGTGSSNAITNGLVFGAGPTNAIAAPGVPQQADPLNSFEKIGYYAAAGEGAFGPSNSMFTSGPFPLPNTQNGKGIEIQGGLLTPNGNISVANSAACIFTCAQVLFDQPGGPAPHNTATRYLYGQLVITFDIPAPLPGSNFSPQPVIHFAGLGGCYRYQFQGAPNSTNFADWKSTLFSTELELVPVAGQSLTYISGNPYFTVSGNNITNSAVTPSGGSTPQIPPTASSGPAFDNYGAATGSVRVNVTPVNHNTVTFNVWLRGSDASQFPWSAIGAPGAGQQVIGGTRNPLTGDTWYVSASMILPTCSTLPVTGVHLNAALNGNDVALSWKTETEINSDHFEIERSKDNINFSRVGSKPAAGNSVSTINYAYTDPSMAAPVYYYRLKLVDINGQFVYSNTAFVRKPNGVKGVRVFPNPVTDQVNIEFVNAKGNYEIIFYNQAGQRVMSRNAVIASTVQYVKMEKGTLAPGSYLISARNTETNEKYVQNVIFQ